MRVSAYEPSAAAAWDDLVAGAPMGTLLHTRAFLGYHAGRFDDASVAINDDDGTLLGVLPAAVDPDDETRVVSHPGATFGGLVHAGRLRGAAMLDAVDALAGHYRACGFTRLGYAAVPLIYHRRPSGDDLYALFRFGATRIRCDLSCAVDLMEGPRLSSRRRRGLAKSRKSGVEVVAGQQFVEELWPIIEQNVAARHGARPTHSAGEMRLLADLFGDEIDVVLARHGGEVIAGVVLFDSPRVSHAQYIASNAVGNKLGGLDAVFDRCLARAAERGSRFFDFGTSNRDGGWVLNDSLFGFKAQFGGGGVAYERYELDLRTATPNPVSP